MTKIIKRRRPLACFHEAGHAVTRWWLGFRVDAAVVLTVEEFRGGVPIYDTYGVAHHIEGAVIGEPIQLSWTRESLAPMPEHHRARLSAWCEQRAEMAMVACSAGTYAEARYLKKSASVRYFYGGFQDGQYARQIAASCFDGAGAVSAALRRADKLAAALVRSSKGCAAIAAVAAALLESGRMGSDGVDRLCSECFEIPFRYGVWDGMWPPTLAQIRSGSVPERISQGPS